MLGRDLLVLLLSIDVGEGFNKGKRAVKSTVKVQESVCVCRGSDDTRCCNKIVATLALLLWLLKFKNLGNYACVYV